MTRLTVHVTTRALANNISHWDGTRLFVHLRATPRENAANFALIELLAELFSIAKTTIHLKRGTHSREKQLEIPLPEQVIQSTLKPFFRN